MTLFLSTLPEAPARASIRGVRCPTPTVRRDHGQGWQVGSSHFSVALLVVRLDEAARRDARIGNCDCDSPAREYRTSTPRLDRGVVGCRTSAMGPCREFRHRTGCQRRTFRILEANRAGTKPLRSAQLALHPYSTTTGQRNVEREIGAGLG